MAVQPVTPGRRVRRLAGGATLFCAAAGALALAGCGGKGSDPYADALACSTTHPCPNPPSATVTPATATRQVGSGVTFVAADGSGLPRVGFQWSRSGDGGRTYVALPGATAASYTVASVALADDGALFVVTITNLGDGTPATAVARLGVSATPPLSFQDGEFDPARWASSAVVAPGASAPPASAPAHSEAQRASGGNPGAYRSMTQVLPVRAYLRVLHTSLPSVWDPAAAGPIRYLDYRQDCINLHAYASMQSGLLLRQGERSFVTRLSYGCPPMAGWLPQSTLTTLTPADFMLLDGPACASGAACPDFSAAGLPISFGYASGLFFARGSDPLTIEHGIDNWSVTVWR